MELQDNRHLQKKLSTLKSESEVHYKYYNIVIETNDDVIMKPHSTLISKSTSCWDWSTLSQQCIIIIQQYYVIP